MEWLTDYHLGGIVIGICTFLIIGLFHPIVVKAEYYWGTRCWWIFLILGIAGIIGSILINDILISSLIGVFSFSSGKYLFRAGHLKNRVQWSFLVAGLITVCFCLPGKRLRFWGVGR